jgi:ParB-like chromosome segregation protein Spo0J
MPDSIRHSELVFNLDLYPRQKVDEERVGQLREVLECRGFLPPIVIDTKRRLVDGYHRARAYHDFAGPDFRIPCEIREYASDADLFLDAVRCNAEHGLPLTDADRGYSVALARKHGVTTEQLATVLSVRTERVASLRGLAKPVVRRAAPHVRARARGGPQAERYVEPLKSVDFDQEEVGLREINRLTVMLQRHEIDAGHRHIRQALKNLIAVAIAEMRRKEERGQVA